MNNKMICSKCKKRPAVIFVSRVDGDKTTQEGYCIKCATELNIGPIKQMMQSMGITEDDIEAVSEQFGDMMENLDEFLDVVEKIAYILIYSANKSVGSFEDWLKGIEKIDLSASWIGEVTEFAVSSFC